MVSCVTNKKTDLRSKTESEQRIRSTWNITKPPTRGILIVAPSHDMHPIHMSRTRCSLMRITDAATTMTSARSETPAKLHFDF